MAISQQKLTQEINTVLAQLTDDIKKQRLEIPSPPTLLIKLRALTSDDRSTAQDISELVKLDPNISGRLIKVANSSLFGSRVHVTSTKAAVTRLGSSKVQNLVISLLIAQNFMSAKIKGLEGHFNNAWQQSNYIAAIAYVLAQKKTTLDPEQALLAGMVHNFGVLPLILRLSSIPELKGKPELLSHVADIVIPKLYPSAGKLILDNWNFSESLSNIALSHNKIERESPGELNLNDLIAISYELHKLDDMTDAETLPEKLVSSSIFKKLWLDWADAASDLSQFASDITQLKNEITN